MNKNQNNKSYLTLMLASSSMAFLAACGGSSSSAPKPVEPPTPPQVSFPTQVSAPAVMDVDDNGSIILSAQGLSLYTFDNDTLGKSVCEGTPDNMDSCAGKWPPLLAGSAAQVTDNMTLISRSDNTLQWAYKDMPLYHWHLDTVQGDVGGDGVNNVWHLARPMPVNVSTIKGVASYVANHTVATVMSTDDVLTPERAAKHGFTLYTFDNDPVDESVCKGPCINAWPPILADGGAKAQWPLTLIDVADDQQQWAYKGKGLYLFVGDNERGDINGDNVKDVWHIATQEPAIERSVDNAKALTAIGAVSALLPVDGSETEFSVQSVAKDGFSLYTFDNDVEGKSNCQGACLVNWPAFVPHDDDQAIGEFSIFEREDGTKQWAHAGNPLYFFIGDTEKGQANGDNIKDVWHLITPPTLTNFADKTADTLGATITVSGKVHVAIHDAENDVFVDQIIDKSGFSLYTFDNDSAGVSNCAGVCLQNWPALLADEKDVASAPYSFIERADGMKQWAINGMALYFFTPDTAQADVKGENAGTVWHIARPAPVKVDVHSSEGNLLAAHGNVLDSQGKTASELSGLTLYTFDDDVKDSGQSTCFDSCAVTWPPLYTVSADQAYGDFTVIERQENNQTTYQWSYQGLPLYFFVGDVNVGDTNGDYPTWTIARP